MTADPRTPSRAERERLRALLQSVKPGGSIEIFADEIAVVLSLLAALDEGEREIARQRTAVREFLDLYDTDNGDDFAKLRAAFPRAASTPTPKG